MISYWFLKKKIGYEEEIMAKKIGDKSCQSNFDKQSSDFGSFLVV